MTTVTVACKITNGIRIGDIVIHGPKAFVDPFQNSPPPLTVGGFVLTQGIDVAVWNKWLEANKDSHMVKEGLIYADEDLDIIRQKALGDNAQHPMDAMAMIRQNAGPRR